MTLCRSCLAVVCSVDGIPESVRNQLGTHESCQISVTKESQRFSAEESLGLQKQPDGQQRTESSDEQRDFHPQG